MFFLDEDKELRISFDLTCPVTPYSIFLLSFFTHVKGLNVLDYGFGSGILSIYAVRKGAKQVCGIDRNKSCLEIALENSQSNNTPHIRFEITNGTSLLNHFCGDFDVVICNPASLPSAHKLPCFLNSGPYGVEMIFDLIKDSKKLLKTRGELFFVRTSLVPKNTVEDFLKIHGFTCSILNFTVVAFREIYDPMLPHLENLKKMGIISFDLGRDGRYYETLYLYRAVLR